MRSSHPLRFALPALLPLLALGCEQPVYRTTPVGTLLADWSAPPPTKETGPAIDQELMGPDGTRYRVKAKMGEAGARKVPFSVRVELAANPTAAEITALCSAPMNYAADAPDTAATVCTALESTGTKSLLRTQTRQHRVLLRVVGDGHVVLESDKVPPPKTP